MSLGSLKVDHVAGPAASNGNIEPAIAVKVPEGHSISGPFPIAKRSCSNRVPVPSFKKIENRAFRVADDHVRMLIAIHVTDRAGVGYERGIT